MTDAPTSRWLRAARALPFHPFLFAAFVPLGAWAANVDLVRAVDAAWWVFASSAFALVVLTASGLVLGLRKGALLTSVIVVVVLWPCPDPWRPLVLAAAGLVGLGLRRLGVDDSHPTTIAHLCGLSLMLMPAWSLATAWTGAAPARDGSVTDFDALVPRPSAETLPDVWWIVLDAHGRGDVLAEKYGVEGDFAGWLRSRDFYVAHDARANYGQTMLALSAALNLEPVADLVSEEAAGPSSRLLLPLLDDSRVVRLFRQRGYRVVVYGSEFALGRIGGADTVRAAPTLTNEFDHKMFQATVFPLISRLVTGSRAELELWLRRKTLEWTFHDLARGDRDPGPTLVIAHLVAPHPPFVFDRDGSPRSTRTASLRDGSHWDEDREGGAVEDYADGYRRQVEWIDARMRTVIDGILAHSDRPPVIVVTGDHGPGADLDWEDLGRSDIQERFTILSAFHLPGGDHLLYPSITPVNGFRVILASVFGADLPLVPDRSLYQTWNDPFRGVDVTDRLGPMMGPDR